MFRDNNSGELIFDSSNYESKELFWATISEQLKILTNEGYEVLVSAEELALGIYRLQYAHDPYSSEDDWGCHRFMLVTSEEEDDILAARDCAEGKE